MHATSIVNGVDLDRLSETIDAVTADPALARFRFRARNHDVANKPFLLDGEESLGGCARRQR
jgi:hypothetical protein